MDLFHTKQIAHIPTIVSRSLQPIDVLAADFVTTPTRPRFAQIGTHGNAVQTMIYLQLIEYCILRLIPFDSTQRNWQSQMPLQTTHKHENVSD